MKTKRIYGFFAVTLILIILMSCEKKITQNDPAINQGLIDSITKEIRAESTHIITLVCDTKGIDTTNYLNKCRFIGQATNIATKDFIYPYLEDDIVEVDENVVWRAQDLEGNEIKVLNIQFLEGHNPFANKDLPGNAANGRVRARPNSNTPSNTPMRYSIRIHVPGNKPFTIDPILRVGQ